MPRTRAAAVATMQGGRVFAGVCGGFVNGFGCASRQHGLSLEIRFGDGFNKAADRVKWRACDDLC